MQIFSVIEVDGRSYYLTDEQARYFLKESVYHGEDSKFLIYYNPYYDIDGNKLPTFKRVGEEEPYNYEPDERGEYLLNKENEYYNPLDGQERFRRDCQYIKDQFGLYIFDSTTGTFVDPYKGVIRYRSEGEFTYEENPEGEYLYDPLLEKNHGFYLPYMDKNDFTILLTRYRKVSEPGLEISYVEDENGEFIYDDELKIYYNPYYKKKDQTVLLTRYNIGSDITYTEDENGDLIFDNGIYYNPYDSVQRYTPSDELSTFIADENGEYIKQPLFDINSRPNFGFYNEFPEWDMEKEEFILGSENIFEVPDEDKTEYITSVDIDDAELELGSIDRLNGESLRDESKMRSINYIRLSSGQKYSITNDNSYWMQIFEYKYDEVLKDYIFIKSYKVTYGLLFTLHNLTTHVRVASGDGDTTDLTNVKIRMVPDPDATSYVFTGPIYETFNEAYQAGYYYFFDSSDRSQFCKLVGDGKNCQAYERYQISTKILKKVSEIEDATNRALSRIVQTGAEITAEVNHMDKNLRSYIQQQMNVIRLEVIDGDNDLHTQIQLTADAITSMATSEFTILKSGKFTQEELDYSAANPENFIFSDLYPSFVNGEFKLNQDRCIYSGYADAYSKNYLYFKPGFTFISSDMGRYILNGTYYMPYEEELKAGRHRYKFVAGDTPDEDRYEIDDVAGIYILIGSNYINPYSVYPRFEKYATFYRLTYNMVDGYGYDIYTSSTFDLKSIIEQTASQIRLEVSDTSGVLISRLIQTEESISSEVANFKKETNTKFKQTSENISAIVSSAGSEIIENDANLLNGITEFYSTRPSLKDDSFIFNSEYKKDFGDYKSAYVEEYFYFAHEPIYISYENGDYINVDGTYINPYEGVQRYSKIETIGTNNNTVSYISHPNGRYIKNGNLYSDPYADKTRYMKEPCYCEVVKNGETYTANLLVSNKHKNEAQIDLTSKQVYIGVTDTTGAMSSLIETAKSIRAEVTKADGAQASLIEQSAEKILFNTLSSVFCIETFTGSNIPSSVSGIANIWYKNPPRYENGSLVWSKTAAYSSQYNDYDRAYAQKYPYCDAGNAFVEDPAGRYISTGEKSVGNYYNPMDGVKRFTRVIQYVPKVEYVSSTSGRYVFYNGNYADSYSITDDISNLPRFDRVTTTVEDETFVEDANGRYILSPDGSKYFDPYNGKTRYEIYPSFYFIDKIEGVFCLTQFAFLESRHQSEIEQTSEKIKLTVSDESSGRQSSISQTTEQIKAQISDAANGLQTSIDQTADKIELLARAGADYIVSESHGTDLPTVTALYEIAPTYDFETSKYLFDDINYNNRHKYPNLNVHEAFSKGYVYFANHGIIYVPDSNGDYVENGGIYVNPYSGGITRYSKKYYDYDTEGFENHYSYIEDANGRFIRSLDKDRSIIYVDPYLIYESDGSTKPKVRYSEFSAADGITSYNMLTNIIRTMMEYEHTVHIETSDGVILAGDVYIQLNEVVYKITTSQDIFENYFIKYNIASKVFTYGIGTSVYETFAPSSYEILGSISDVPEGAVVCSGFVANYNDIYYWETRTNLGAVQSTAIKQTNKEISLKAQDMEGYASQIRQTATDITSIVSGAPTEVMCIEGAEAEALLNTVSEYYNTIPQYDDEHDRYSFDGMEPLISHKEVALHKNYRFFAGDAGKFVQDNNGEYIREVVIKDPVYRYFNPKEEPDRFGIPYYRYANVVQIDESGDVNNKDSLYFLYTGDLNDLIYEDYFVATDGNTYYSPWLSGTRYKLDSSTDSGYSEDVNGMYVREEVEQPTEYKIYRPYYEDDNITQIERRSKSYEASDAGNLIMDDDGNFYDPLAGKRKYRRYYRKLTSLDTIDFTRVYIEVSPGEYILPYFDKNDQITPLIQYRRNENIEENSDNLPYTYQEISSPTTKATTLDDTPYVIDVETGEFIQPYKSVDLYERVYELSNAGQYLIDANSSDGYCDPYARKARYELVYKVDGNGRYIFKDGVWIDPYDGIDSSLRYEKYPTYCKFYYSNSTYVVKFFSRINNAANSKIEQTANSISLEVSDDRANTETRFSVTNEEIRSELHNLEDDIHTEIQVRDNQIRQTIADNQNNLKAEVVVNADSIDHTISGSFIKIESGSKNIGTGQLILYNEVPKWNPVEKRFDNRGYTRTASQEGINDAINEGFKYTSTGAVTTLACSPANAEGYINDSGEMTPVSQKYSLHHGEQTLIANEYTKITTTYVSGYRYLIYVDGPYIDVAWILHSKYPALYANPTVTEYHIFRPVLSFTHDELVYWTHEYYRVFKLPLPRYKFTKVEGEVNAVEYKMMGVSFEEDVNGEFISSGGGFKHITTWCRSVNGYYRYTNYDSGEVDYDFFIRTEDDYSSKISQTANSIRMSVENSDRETKSEIAITDAEIRQEVKNLDEKLSAEIIVNLDSIDHLVTGSNVLVATTKGYFSSLSFDLQKTVPIYESGSFVAETDSNLLMAGSSDAVNSGYRYYADGVTYTVLCGPADADTFYIGDTPYYNYEFNGPYKRTYTRTIEDNLATYSVSYEASENGNYVEIDGTYYRLTRCTKSVSAYYRFAKYSTTRYIRETYIRSEDDYSSRISQSANSIELSVENGEDVAAAIGLWIDSDDISHVHISGNRFSVDSSYFTLDEYGNMTAESGIIGSFTLDTDGIYMKSPSYGGMLSAEAISATGQASLISSGSASAPRFYCGGRDTKPYIIDCEFLVLEDGSLYANAARIGNMYFKKIEDAAYLYTTTSSGTGLLLGNLYNNGELKPALAIGDISFSSGEPYINSANASISTNGVYGELIYGGIISADTLKTSEIAPISGYGGTITMNWIEGNTISATCSSSGNKITVNLSQSAPTRLEFTVYYNTRAWGGGVKSTKVTVSQGSTSGSDTPELALLGYVWVSFTSSKGSTTTYIASGSSGIGVTGSIFTTGGNYDIGSNDNKWNNIYSNTCSACSSDRKIKKDIIDIPDVYDSIYNETRPQAYKFVNGTSDRLHFGIVAQDLEDIVLKHDVSTKDFAPICKSLNAVTGEENYSIRYGEFVSLNIWQIQKLRKRMDKLELILLKYGIDITEEIDDET